MTAARAEILAVERQWTTAHLQGDFATIAQLMAGDYIRIQPDGSAAPFLSVYVRRDGHWQMVAEQATDIR